jgi:transposase
MATTTASVPRDWREGRRFRAWELAQQGWSQRLIAAALGVTPGAVSQWLRRVREGGVDGVRRRVAPGRVPKLTAEQRAQLPGLLAWGAHAWGVEGEVWTTPRVAAVIEQAFGVRYHPAHLSRRLRAIGGSPQTPIQRATQRDEAAIAAWYATRWPALKKGPRAPARPESGWTNRACTGCPLASGPLPRARRRRSCACP